MFPVSRLSTVSRPVMCGGGVSPGSRRPPSGSQPSSVWNSSCSSSASQNTGSESPAIAVRRPAASAAVPRRYAATVPVTTASTNPITSA